MQETLKVISQAGAAVLPHEKTLLIVDDDKSFATRLSRAMELRGFEVRTADTVQEGLAFIRTAPRPMRWSTCASMTATGST